MNTKIEEQKNMLDTAWQLFLVFAIVIGATMVPMEALASSNAIEETLCKVVGLFTSGTGKAIATVAVIVIGVGALMGKVSWGLALIVALGIALIFGAATIVNAVAPSSGGGGCSTTGGTPPR